jgi:hypothetical protein
VWDVVTSAAGSDARKRDDGDAFASSRSDETFERALDAPDGSGEWFSLFAPVVLMGSGSRNSRPPFAKRMPAAESPGHDARIHSSAAC